MANDSLGDMLTRIRNAAAVGHSKVAVRASKLNERVAQILKEEGYLDAYEVIEVDGKRTLSLTLRYSGERRSRKPVITGLQRVSRPGRASMCRRRRSRAC